MSPDKSKSSYYAEQPNPGNLLSKLSLKVRERMFATLMEITGADSRTKVLDVGVTNDERIESNFLERLYPYPENITAVGLEDASFLESKYPGVRYLQADALNLSFADKTFDLVTSFAVIEHVGCRDDQQRFVQELCRVGKSCVITTPNRWYPMEVHTMSPLIHWLPPGAFRTILRTLGKEFYAQEKNLNLLDAKTLRRMFPKNMKITEHHNRLLGIVSNLFFFSRH
jgi:2-polyprenyl-3-methyl-5-hydroxy-6-metoxy-1,4-benzoquinol methylase